MKLIILVAIYEAMPTTFEIRLVNINDDGRVIGHVSADDVEVVEKIDHIHIEYEQ